jgi:hypothetical protein
LPKLARVVLYLHWLLALRERTVGDVMDNDAFSVAGFFASEQNRFAIARPQLMAVSTLRRSKVFKRVLDLGKVLIAIMITGLPCGHFPSSKVCCVILFLSEAEFCFDIMLASRR